MLAYLQLKLKLLQLQIQLALLKVPTTGQRLFLAAQKSVGKHMTLNDSIPAEVGCAEAVSAVLSQIGVSDGPQGIAGTAALYQWLSANPKFVSISLPEEGAVLVSPTGSGNGSVEGHTGIFGAFNTTYSNDWEILSNSSATGLFSRQWSWARWQAYYGVTGGLPLHMFRCV